MLSKPVKMLSARVIRNSFFSKSFPLTLFTHLPSMQYDYRKIPSSLAPQGPWISVPHLPIRLSVEGRSIDIYALVDSGADTSLFHSSIAKKLGIELTSGLKHNFIGISGEAVDGYFHKL